MNDVEPPARPAPAPRRRRAKLSLHRHRRHSARPVRPGDLPGIESFVDRHVAPPAGAVPLRVCDYGPDGVTWHEPADVDALLDLPRPADARVRWINVDGLHPHVVARLAEAFGMHSLAAEDTLNVPQRPKAEAYGNDLFLRSRAPHIVDGSLHTEQVSYFVSPPVDPTQPPHPDAHGGLLISFQEEPGDVWAPLRRRLDDPATRLRQRGVDYLLYALLDAVIDHGFPVLESIGDRLEVLELQMLEDPDPALLKQVYLIRGELAALRRVLWPTREMLAVLMDEACPVITAGTREYLRDVQEHNVQTIEIAETLREVTAGLTDLHLSAVSNHMNEVMKFLTILGSLFIPITFLAGLYGMNFQHMPELQTRYGYFVFLGVCVMVTGGLLIYFRRKGWIGK